MTTQKTTFESKPYSALFINGPYESRNVGIKLYFRYQLFCLSISHGITPLEGVGGGVSRRAIFKEYLQNRLSDECQFLGPLHRSIFERETLLIPHAYSQHVLGELHYQGATPLEEMKGLLCQIMIQRTISSYSLFMLH